MDDQIRDTISNHNTDRAHELLRIALRQNPTAETYYLASQVALNDEQKRDFLEKALQLDPFHNRAVADLSNIKNQTGNSWASPAVLQDIQFPNPPSVPFASNYIIASTPYSQHGYAPLPQTRRKPLKALPLILIGTSILAIFAIGLIVFLLNLTEILPGPIGPILNTPTVQATSVTKLPANDNVDFPPPPNVTKLPASDSDIRNALLAVEKESSFSSNNSFNSFYSKADSMEVYVSKDSRASVVANYNKAIATIRANIYGFASGILSIGSGQRLHYTKGNQVVLFYIGSIDKSQAAGGCGCIFGIDKIPPAIQKNVSQGDTLIYELKGSSTMLDPNQQKL